MLIKRLPDALNDPALNLAFQHDRIYDDAKIIDTGKTVKLHLTSCRINLDLGNMTAIGIAGALAGIGLACIEHVLGFIIGFIISKGDNKIFQRYRSVACLIGKDTIVKHQILLATIQFLRC